MDFVVGDENRPHRLITRPFGPQIFDHIAITGIIGTVQAKANRFASLVNIADGACLKNSLSKII
jgi:hypothetical protein